MEAGLGRLGCAPRDFWAMTPRELRCALAGRFGTAGAETPTRADIDGLMALYPDLDATRLGDGHG